MLVLAWRAISPSVAAFDQADRVCRSYAALFTFVELPRLGQSKLAAFVTCANSVEGSGPGSGSYYLQQLLHQPSHGCIALGKPLNPAGEASLLQQVLQHLEQPAYKTAEAVGFIAHIAQLVHLDRGTLLGDAGICRVVVLVRNNCAAQLQSTQRKVSEGLVGLCLRSLEILELPAERKGWERGCAMFARPRL